MFKRDFSKRLISLLLCALMVTGLFPAGAFAEETELEPQSADAVETVTEPAPQEEPDQEPEPEPAPETEPAPEPVQPEEETLASGETVVPENPDLQPSESPEETEVPSPEGTDESTQPPTGEEGDASLLTPNTEENQSAAVRVEFTLTPEDTILEVYTKDEQGEKTVLQPEEDGSYSLLPGIYYYSASAEGFTALEETEFEVSTETEDTMEITVELLPDEDVEVMSVVASGECGNDLTWELDDAGVLTISGTGAMYNYDSQYQNGKYVTTAPWGSGVMNVVFQNGITSIGDSAFLNCSNVTEIIVPESVVKIGSRAFSKCSGLSHIVIPDSVKSLGYTDGDNYSGYAVFSGCDSLVSAGPIGSNSSYEYGWKDGIPQNAFEGCTGLERIVFPETIKTIGIHAFFECVNLSQIVIPEGVTSIGTSAFCRCKSLVSITLPDSLTSIGKGAFSFCENLPGIALPVGLKSIDNDAFECCSSLSNISIPETVTSIGEQVFYGCINLSSINVSENNAFFCSLDGVLYNKGGTLLLQYPVGREGPFIVPDGVTGIEAYAFRKCEGLTEVFVPDSVTNINKEAFSGCRNMAGVSLSEGLISIGRRAFYGCVSLTEVSIPNSVISIDDEAFSGCTSLITVVLPESLTGDNRRPGIYDKTFFQCYSLTSISIPKNSEIIGNNAFDSCSDMESISIPVSIVVIGDGAFRSCSSLSDVYYEGTSDQWNAIKISSRNDPLLKATIHYGGGEPEPPEVYSITVDQTIKGGEVSVTGSTGEEIASAEPGETIMVSCIPETGYVLSNVEVENNEIGICAVLQQVDTNTYSFEMPDYDVTVKASFMKKGEGNIGFGFTVNFNKNAANATGSMKKLSGKVTSSNTLTACDFKWKGHSFTSWNTKADGSGTSYSDKTLLSQIITENNQSVTLYAQWDVTKYTITYNTNGGSPTPADQILVYGKQVTLSSQVLTRPGYTFKGWATTKKDADAGRVKYKAGAVYKTNADLTLYAAWAPATYQLIFDGNGVTKGAAESKLTITFNKSFTMKSSGFTKNGYVLKGWSLEKHPALIQYQQYVDFASGKKMTAAECADLVSSRNYAGTIRLYAVWGPVEYKITYQCVPSSAYDYLTNPNSELYNAMQGITFADPGCKGHTFIGIYSDSACKNPVSGFEAGTTGNKKVYLKFEPHSYTVRFDGNGGTGNKAMKDMSCTVGKQYTLPANTFEKPGYVFSKWEYDGASSCITVANKAKVKDLSFTDGAVVIMRALYTPIEYTVTLNANGGKFTDGKTTKAMGKAFYDRDLVLPAASALQERSGYTLVGWNTKADCSDDDLKAGSAVKNLTAKSKGSVTLYAVWEYEIILDGNGGKCKNGDPTSKLKLRYKNAYKLGDQDFAHEGGRFIGWSTSTENARKGTVINAKVKNLKPNSVLYASWKANYFGITVTLYRNENQEDKAATERVNLTSLDNLPLADDLNWNSADKFKFKCWSSNRLGTGLVFEDGASINDLINSQIGSFELYAQYYKGTHLDHHMGSYSLRQGDYNEFNQPYGYNAGCCAVAYAAGLSIVTGNAYNPTQFWYGGLTHYDAGHKSGWEDFNADKIYQELQAGHPFQIAYIYSDSPIEQTDADHFVLIIGVKEDANFKNLQFEDFIVIDPAYGDERLLTSSWNFNTNRVTGGFFLM